MLVLAQWRRELVALAAGAIALLVLVSVWALAPWRAFVPVKMAPRVTPPAAFSYTAPLQGREGYSFKGTVALASAVNGTGVWLVNYDADPVRAPRLLVTAAAPEAIRSTRPAGALDLGAIPGSNGSASFVVPAGVDPAQLKTAVVYDEGVDRVVALAEFRPVPPPAPPSKAKKK